MKDRQPSKLTFAVPAVVCLAVSLVMALQLTRQMREDLYWTPVQQAPTLDAARPRAEVLVDGRLLQELVADNRVEVDGRPLAAEDTTLRFNNVDAVTRAQMIILSAAASAGLAFMVAAILVPARRRRGSVSPRADGLS